MRLLYATGVESGVGPVATGSELGDEELETLYGCDPGRHVRLGFVTSVDGATKVEGRSGGLGGDDDHRLFATLRSLCDVILVGSGTARAENYGPARLSAPRRQRRRERGQAEFPPVAVVNRGADLDPTSRLFVVPPGEAEWTGPRPLVLCAASAPDDRRRALAEVAEVVVCGDEQVDATTALDELAARGLQRVLCEGGPTLAGTLLRAGRVSDLCLSQAALLAGPDSGSLTGGDPFDHPVTVELQHLLAGDQLLAARWALPAS